VVIVSEISGSFKLCRKESEKCTIFYGMVFWFVDLCSSYILLLGMRMFEIVEIILFLIFALIVSNRW